MKKVLSWIIFILSFCVFAYDMCFAILGATQIKTAFDKLAATPGASGIDYWGVGADVFMLLVIAFTILGMILSIISCKLSYNRVLKILSYVILICFLLPIPVSALIIL